MDIADPSQAQQPEPPAPPSSKLVLIADDDATVRDLLVMTVEMEGFQVVSAVNGRKAVEEVNKKVPDLIITDLMMPELGGYEFLRELQAAGAGRVPVFVVSASQLDDSTIAMIKQEANVVGFVPKPVRMANFKAGLHTTLKTQPPAAAPGASRGLNDRISPW